MLAPFAFISLASEGKSGAEPVIIQHIIFSKVL